ncbi:oligosaccharide flippase family protein [Wohlfahrtiimonas chitiniclastica]|uniref:oligosaccharide flippase family protein n=1 Tax=Wohlfahrtiimonas chitiniclastica TaxID=400946 RepID=UPI0011D16D04|nr:oligosaccharide flippase family protein [Wohlfahrtiimonas chitiniclastica]
MCCQVGGMIIPLLELPILTRNLKPTEYGELIYLLGITLIAGIIIEYGFNFSVTRKILSASDPNILGKLCSDVFLAKVFLSIGVIIGIIIFLSLSSNIRLDKIWLIYIVIISLAIGFTPMWFFIVTEALIVPAILDLGIRLLGMTALLIILPFFPSGEIALLILSITGILNTLIPSMLMLNQVSCAPLCCRRSLLLLKEGFHLFIYKSTQTIQQALSSLMLGYLGNAQFVGMFAPAEKLSRAVIGLLVPIINIFFPHFTRLRSAENKESGKKFFLFFMGIISIGLIMIMLIIIWLAPLIIQILFGSAYLDSIKILQYMAVLIPFKGMNILCNILWFVPIGKEKIVNNLIALNIFLVVVMAIIMIPNYGVLGFVLGLISIEVLILILMIFFVRITWKAY